MTAHLTSGELCRKYGLLPWQITFLISRGLLKASGRAGRCRFWTRESLPGVEKVLQEAGYLRTEELAHA
jgi:hypothetical protein